MRRLMCFEVVLLLGILLPMGAFARKQESQPAAQEENVRSHIELLRSELRADKTAVIAAVMQFNDSDAMAFWPIYRDYESDLARLYDARVEAILDYAVNYLEMTDEKADDLAMRALEWEERRTELKKKYYERFKHALSPMIAARFLQVENQILALMDLQIASSLPVIESGETPKK